VKNILTELALTGWSIIHMRLSEPHDKSKHSFLTSWKIQQNREKKILWPILHINYIKLFYRRGLTAVPLLPNETKLRLFSLQHNFLLKLDGISTCGLTPSRLVFLDLYDNQVERISGLDALENLRVLLLGKNK